MQTECCMLHWKQPNLAYYYCIALRRKIAVIVNRARLNPIFRSTVIAFE